MESFDLTQLIQALIPIILAIITRYAVPWLKAITNDRTYANIRSNVQTFVMAAEQLYKGEGQGALKFEYVQTELAKLGIVIDFKPIIEAAVLELKNRLALVNKDES